MSRKTSRSHLPEVLYYLRDLGRPATLMEIAEHLNTNVCALHWLKDCTGSVTVEEVRPSSRAGGNNRLTYDVVTPVSALTAHWPAWKVAQ